MDGTDNDMGRAWWGKPQLVAIIIVMGSITLRELPSPGDLGTLHVHPPEYCSRSEEQLDVLKVAPSGSFVLDRFDYLSSLD
jgi:hypothetical protein